MSRTLIVIPLQPGAFERAAALARQGPPFDPEDAGLERCHVFVTEHELVLVLEGSSEAIERLQDAVAWAAASDWADLAAGPVRVAEALYDWIRLEPPENVVFTSTPGPGDSDGGDVYAP